MALCFVMVPRHAPCYVPGHGYQRIAHLQLSAIKPVVEFEGSE